MEISKVQLNNFKQYYGIVEVNLSATSEKNLVVIGGKNGHGKTNFLVSLVWCLYGNNISSVDDFFRKEVKGGYSRFLAKALNWQAKQEGITSFSVSIKFSNVEISEGFYSTSQGNVEVQIVREYNTIDGNETLNILINGSELELMKEDEEKMSFINDYIIPIQAAKFVFFDAEKIAEIAELNLSEQGRIMNEALGKLLGLDTYSNLVDDLEAMRKNLKKESATKEIYDNIEVLENKKELNSQRITELKESIENIDEKIYSNQREIADIEKFLTDHGVTLGDVDLAALLKRKKELEEQKSEISVNLFDHLEIIPFCISAGKMQEVISQLNLEEEYNASQYENENFKEKSNALIESLFNKEPFPNEDISLKQKSFYLEKADQLFNKIFLNSNSIDILDFQHDLSRSDIQHIHSVYNALNLSNDERFETLYTDLIKIDNDLNKVTNDIRKAEGEVVDDEITEIRSKKDSLFTEIGNLNIEKGKMEQEKIGHELENNTLETRIENLLTTVSISKNKKKKLEDISKYIEVLNSFIDSEKREKHEKIATSILQELNHLMHKKLIQKVKVQIIPDNKGLEVLLYNIEGNEILKDDLSKGEQQLYISSLLKSILNESISDLPVFIDTPLGRLDREHKENILDNYYPSLANQVVIFSTDDEITTGRLKRIEKIVSRTYLLENSEGNTIINPGYFN